MADDPEYQEYLEYLEYIGESPVSAGAPPMPTTKQDSYGERFVRELGSPEGIKDTVMGIPSGVWGAMKGAYGAVEDLPENISNIADDPLGSVQRNGVKALGSVGKIASRVNPAFMITGPAYDKLLSVIDPGTFEPTTPEQDAAKVRGESIMGAGGILAARGANLGAQGIKRGGAFLDDKLSTKTIPEQVIPGFREQGASHAVVDIPEVRAQYTDWSPPPTFNEIFTAAKRAQGLKTARGVDPETGVVTSRTERAVSGNRDILDLPAEKSLGAVMSKKDAALAQADDIVREAEARRVPLEPTTSTTSRVVAGAVDEPVPHPFNSGPAPTRTAPTVIDETVTIPPSYTLETPRAVAAIERIQDPIKRARAAEYLAEKTGAFESQWDGSLETLHSYRKELTGTSSKAINKGIGDVIPEAKMIDAALTKDLNNMIDASATGYKAANAPASEMISLELLAKSRAAKARAIQEKNMAAPVESEVFQKGEYVPAQSTIGKWIPEKTIPEKTTPGAWAGKLDNAARILGPALGYAKGDLTGAAMGAAVTAAGGIGNLTGKVAGGVRDVAGGLQQALTSPALKMMQGGAVGPMAGASAPQLLPRDSERFKSDAIEAFLMKTSSTPQATIAQQLVGKLQKAFQAEDMDTIEKIHSDMTRIFPDLFEPGVGVNGKVFYPDEQAKVMDQLKQFQRMGMVDSIHLAKQRNSFNNPQDSRVLPMTPAQKPTHDGAPRFHEGTRVYSY